MSVEELIAKLSAYPPHFTVEAFITNGDDDATEDIVDVNFTARNQKVVHVELAGPLHLNEDEEEI